MHIKSLSDYNKFLKSQKFNSLEEVIITVPHGAQWELKGIKWVNELIINKRSSRVAGGAITYLSLPDLKLINGDFTPESESRISIHLPHLEEIRGNFITSSNYDGCNEFACIDQVCDIYFPKTCHVNNDRGCSINLANDVYYTLQFNSQKNTFTAGCRTFKSIDGAIKHWTRRANDFKNDFPVVSRHDKTRDSICNRALMFVFALTNFKEEMCRGGLI